MTWIVYFENGSKVAVGKKFESVIKFLKERVRLEELEK